MAETGPQRLIRGQPELGRLDQGRHDACRIHAPTYFPAAVTEGGKWRDARSLLIMWDVLEHPPESRFMDGETIERNPAKFGQFLPLVDIEFVAVAFEQLANAGALSVLSRTSKTSMITIEGGCGEVKIRVAPASTRISAPSTSTLRMSILTSAGIILSNLSAGRVTATFSPGRRSSSWRCPCA